LRLGDEGRHVERLQHLLIAEGAPLVADGEFGPKTQSQVRAYQRRMPGLGVDGVVGPSTWGALEAAQEARAVDDAEAWGWGPLERPAAPQEPAKPDFGPIVGNHGRQQVFGKFKFAPAPTPTNREGIRFLDDWPDKNIVTAHIPQLMRIPGIEHEGRIVGAGPKSGNVSVHRLVAEPAKALWQAWDDAGLCPHIITWGGWWNPRFIRRSQSVLSNHAFATAFDINVPFNGLGRPAASAGKRGSVMELVPIASELGWFWGGFFARVDAMHFEASERCLR
jgi:hypothetical protein